MTQPKNETTALLLSLGLTAVVVGGGFWWLKNSGIFGGTPTQSNAPAQTANEQPTNAPFDSSSSSNSSSNSASNSWSFSRSSAGDINVPSGEFRYGGSTSWAPLRGTVDPMLQTTYPSFRLNYQNTSGSGDGIQKLINGELDFAQSSRPLTSKEKRNAQQSGIALEEIPVMTEAVAIAVHPDLAVPGITLSQLKDIYTGQIANWNQVGGPNLAIVPASRSAGGTVQFFEEDVLEGDSFTSSLQEISTTTQALRFVSENPGAIYFASAPEVVGQCTVKPLAIGTSAQQLVPPYQQPYVSPENCPAQRNQLNIQAIANNTYPLTRPLYVIVKEDGGVVEQAGTAYAELLQTTDGRSLLNQAGFVPIQ